MRRGMYRKKVFRESLTTKDGEDVEGDRQTANVDNNQPLTQSSKIDNAFASSAHFSSSVNGARAIPTI